MTKKKSTSYSKKFVPPTLEEVEAYVKEKGLSVDAGKFHAYYEAGNWHDSKGQPVKSWKQKALTWERHNQGGGAYGAGGRRAGPNPRKGYDAEAERRKWENETSGWD